MYLELHYGSNMRLAVTGLHLMQLEVEVSDIRWQYPLIIMCCFLSQKKIALMKPKYGH